MIGGGVIGASWAALFLANGLNVVISDPDPEIEAKATSIIMDAAPALKALGYGVDDITANLEFESDNARAVIGADIVQECGPENLAIKKAMWNVIEAMAPAHALLCSSSSTIPASVQSAHMTMPSRLIVGHPFNPPHLMPLVEVVPAPGTDPEIVGRALAFYQGIGKVALEISKEVPGFVANRLQAAFLQEAFSLVEQGVVRIDQLDDIVTNSLGIRWATSGPFLSAHLGGGAGGLDHFLKHFGPTMEAAWQHLGKPELNEGTLDLFSSQLARSYGLTSISALAERRDAKEIAVMNGLKGFDHA